jgi:hypothetical protein
MAADAQEVRRWEVVGYFGDGAEKFELTSDGNLLDHTDIADGCLVLVRGLAVTVGGEETLPELWRLFQAFDGTYQVSTLDTGYEGSPQGMTRVGGEDWNRGNWLFCSETGHLIAHNEMVYRLRSDDPGYLEAIAKNWKWTDHFAATLPGICPPELKKGFVFGAGDWDPAVAIATLCYFLGQKKLAEEHEAFKKQQAKNGARIEDLEGVIHTVGEDLFLLTVEDKEADLFNLSRMRDSMVNGAIRRTIHRLQDLYRQCRTAEPKYFKGKEERWGLDGVAGQIDLSH